MTSISYCSSAASLLFVLTLGGALPADDWSRFRGSNGSGVSSSTGLPSEVGPETNKAWEAAVPFGRSSPAVAGDRIFLTAALESGLETLAVDRASGNVLWRRSIVRRDHSELYKDTDSATSTPVTDGSNVYAFFHEAGVVSYDSSGSQRWYKPLGPFRNYYGIASSPVLAGDLLLMLCDQAEGSFLVALDTKTGEPRWRRNRPARLESYSTPVVYPAAEDPQAVLVSGSRWVDAYDMRTGESVWALGGVGSGTISSPVLVGDMLFVNSHDHADNGWPPFDGVLTEHDSDSDGRLSAAEVEEAWLFEHFLWLDTDADGSLTGEDWARIGKEMVNDGWGAHAIRLPTGDADAEIVWSYQKNVPNIPSPVVHDGVFYMVRDDIVTSLNAKSGEVLKRGRLGAGKSKVYASPVIADGKIYVATLQGQLVVLTATGDWTVTHTSDLGEEIWATPAIADAHLYVRTKTKLYDFVLGPEVDGAGEAESTETQGATASEAQLSD